jgi:hypothetical protein
VNLTMKNTVPSLIVAAEFSALNLPDSTHFPGHTQKRST